MPAEYSRWAGSAGKAKRTSRIVDVPEADPEKDDDTRLSFVVPPVEPKPRPNVYPFWPSHHHPEG